MAVLDEARTRFLLVVAARLAPGVTRLDAAGVERFRAIVDDALATRPPALQRQFATLLTVVRWLPFARYGRPFERLPPDRQDAVLGWLESAPVGLLRKGFWGLKTLVFMGYYGQPELHPSFAYRPSPDGWAQVRASGGGGSAESGT